MRRIIVIGAMLASVALIGVGAAITQTSFSVNKYGGGLDCGSAWSAAFNETPASYATKFYGGPMPTPTSDGNTQIAVFDARPLSDACISSGQNRVTLGLSLAGLGAAAVIAASAIGLVKWRRNSI